MGRRPGCAGCSVTEAPGPQVAVNAALCPSSATRLAVPLSFAASFGVRAPHLGPRRGTGLSCSGKALWASRWVQSEGIRGRTPGRSRRPSHTPSVRQALLEVYREEFRGPAEGRGGPGLTPAAQGTVPCPSAHRLCLAGQGPKRSWCWWWERTDLIENQIPRGEDRHLCAPTRAGPLPSPSGSRATGFPGHHGKHLQ